MDAHEKFIDSYKTIATRHRTVDELCRTIYRELSNPTFNVQPAASSSQVNISSKSTQFPIDARSMDPATFHMLETQSRQLARSDAQDHVLTNDQRKSFRGLVLLAKNLIAERKLRKGMMAANLSKIKPLPLEVLWWYHSSNIMDITIHIALNLDDSQELERIGYGVTDLLACPNGDGMEAAIASDFISALVSFVHSSETCESLLETKRACGIILNSIIRRQLAAIVQETGAVWWLQKLVGPTGTLTLPVAKSVSSMLLRLPLTEPPYISVNQAFVRQSEWSYHLAPKVLSTFFTNVITGLDPPTLALDILIPVLKGNYEVNWKAVLVFVASFLHNAPTAPAMMSDLITDLLTQAFAKDNRDLLVLSFLLARQCSLETNLVGCTSYPVWFKRSFGNRATLIPTSVANWRFLLEFLTHLVPHEPVACIKAHTDNSPLVPVQVRTQLQDYLALANTRLRDLSHGPTESINGIFQHDPGVSPKNLEEQAKYDVEKALNYFKETEKIHKSVFEGSMFKKKYFESYFIPELLKPRALGTTNDSQMMFIDKLLSAGKITSVQYNSFHSQCLSLVTPT